ncbi:L-type lectin-domain containing receptor kinase S.4-like [Cryptomeria japonica]|uniref:L-type lectin-domain containing receptor kinase S.4-like n=1 Tax=Cryptomeria japonica TaxID=3369 RepID=UPI0027D9DB85|nr:L-type lectin-domain containing receptor kinase S.4-like [Cryptomeria japonica]
MAMMQTWLQILILCLSIILTAGEGIQHENTSFSFIFNHFNATTTIKYVADASLQSNAIRLTNHSDRLVGRAFYDKAIPMKRNGSVISFSTSFIFAMVPQRKSGGGDGVCFIMTPTPLLNGGVASQYLGLVNMSSDGKEYNHLFAVEFDTMESIGMQEKDSNHVGIDLNGVKSLLAESAGYWEQNRFTPIKLKSGHNIRAWIDYDGASKQLEISIAAIGEARPQKALVSKKDLDLNGIMQEYMYVGFSASTGSSPLVEDHYILAWSFTTGNNKASDIDILHLPSFYVKNRKFYKSTKFIYITIICSMAFILGLILSAFYWVKRMDYIEFYEKWELQYWPQRFNYRKLNLATKGFRDDNLLGYGGFGRVYRGTLPSGDEIAVKCITKDFTQGMQEFMAEISSLGRLQHRNLVHLRGWGRKNTRLFIVYDYMFNGSLERNLFSPELNLTWAQRYRILTDVAAGILYLHEEWEKCVVHRDIKSSNVLLDHDLNGRVGDFGLARLYDHSEKPQTTHLVGTLGYIAPELIHSGKASPSTDVFRFGALMLEVACGRKPVDAQGVILVQWVWDLYADERLLEAVDQRLGDDYDKIKVEIVLILGLMCSNPDPNERLSMRKVLQVLCGEASLPTSLRVPSAFELSRIDIADLNSFTATPLNLSE